MGDVSILYYTDGLLDKTRLNKLVRKSIKASGLYITCISLKPSNFGDNNIHFDARRSHQNMFKQTLAGLKEVPTKYVFMCEHDVLYHPSHFEFVPPRDDTYYYNNNAWKYRLKDRKIISYTSMWLSQNCSARDIMIEHYENKLKWIAAGKRAYGYEPGAGQSRHLTKHKAEYWESEFPNVDIRHGKNWSGVGRMDPKDFRNKNACKNWKETTPDKVPGWDGELLLSL